MQPFYLFIDDIREPTWPECVSSGVDPTLPWVIVRSSREAKEAVKARGAMPTHLALDHDLGQPYGDGKTDSVPVFLKWLAREFWNGIDEVPAHTIHSSNPCGAENMKSFMESWKKSVGVT